MPLSLSLSLSLSLTPLNGLSLFLSLMLPWNTEIVMVWLLSWPKGNDWVSEFVYRLGDGFRMDSGYKNVLFYCFFLGNSANQWQSWFLNTGGDDKVCDSNEWVLAFGGIMSDLRSLVTPKALVIPCRTWTHQGLHYMCPHWVGGKNIYYFEKFIWF